MKTMAFLYTVLFSVAGCAAFAAFIFGPYPYYWLAPLFPLIA